MSEDENLFEKRLANLEVVVAGIKEKLASMDIGLLSNLKEKMDDIEDLIMVEQAGILELKKMIEETKGIGIEAPDAARVIEERLKKIENDIASILDKRKEMQVELNERLARLESRAPETGSLEVEKIYKRIDELERSISNMKGVIDELRKILEKEGDMKKISESVSNLSKEINEIRNEVFQKTTEISGLAKKIEESNQRLSSSVSSEINAFKERMKALEAKYDNLSKQMKGVRPEDFTKTMKKIESVSASIEERYRKELEELKSRISKTIKESKTPSMMDTQINELLEKIVSLESRLKVMEKNLDEVVKARPVVLE